MTLVASYIYRGCPILVGDFQLSILQKRSGTCKKLYIINDYLAIGWTGYLSSAERILNILDKKFKRKLYCFREVEEFFTGISADLFISSPIELVGAAKIGPDFICFNWKSDRPNRVTVSPVNACGSGSEKFNDIFYSQTDLISMLEDESRGAYSHALSICSRMAFDEFLPEDRLESQTYGFFYEIVHFNGIKFVYLDDITTSFALMRAPQGIITDLTLVDKTYYYKAVGNLSIVKEIVRDMGDDRHRVRIFGMTTPHDKNEENLKAVLRLEVEEWEKRKSKLKLKNTSLNVVFSGIKARDGTKIFFTAVDHKDEGLLVHLDGRSYAVRNDLFQRHLNKILARDPGILARL